MAQYSTGTVSVTNGSATVTGSGTAWTSYIEAGDIFVRVGDTVPYVVLAVVDDDELTLSTTYAGTTGTGASYVLHTDFTPNRGLPLPARGDAEIAVIMRRAMLALDAVNLSDIDDPAAVRSALGLVIGTNVQAWDTDLDWLAGNITAAGKALLDDADAAAQRTTLGLAIGTNVQAYNATLTSWAGKTVPTGTVVGTTDTQTLDNKTLTGQRVAGTFTRDLSLASGTQAVTGVGFTPQSARFIFAVNTDVRHGMGFSVGTAHRCITVTTGPVAGVTASNSIYVTDASGSNYVVGYVSSWDASGFTITWTKVGSPTGTLTIYFEANK